MIMGNVAKNEQPKENNLGASELKIKSVLVRAVIYTLIVALLSALYLIFAWSRYKKEASSQAIALANSVGAMMPKDQIIELSEGNLDGQEYITIDNNLAELVRTTNSIHHAYLLASRAGSVVIISDSESPGSQNYLPPEWVYKEAADIFSEPFRTGSTTITTPVTDDRGTWICVLVPLKNPSSGQVQAVLGMNYSVPEWYGYLWGRMIPDIIIIICVLILSLALLYGLIQYRMNQILSRKLSYSEALYRNVFEQAPIGIAIVSGENFTYQSYYGHKGMNPMFEKILGRTSQELTNLRWTDITHPEDLCENMKKFEEFQSGKNCGYSMEKRYLRPDGSVVWANIKVSPLIGLCEQNSLHLTVVEDISERKETELKLMESERKMQVLLSHLPGMAYRCLYDHDWTMQFVSEGTYNLTGYKPESLLYNKELSFNDLISPEYRELLWNEWERVLKNRLPFKYEYEIMTKSGERKWVLELGQGIYDASGEVEALEGIVLDISDRKEMEDNLKYMIDHDRWTGLYNREYLETLLENDAKIKSPNKRALISINLNTVQLLVGNYGFHYTQNLIKSASEALSRLSNDKRMLFKTYETRFVFYVKDYTDKNELIEFSEDIAKILEDLFVTDRIGGGIGILEIDRDNEQDVDMLLRRLLITSERASIINRDFGYCFYNKEMEELVNREGDIRSELARIASEDDSGEELFLQYQPILDLKTDTICGFEALARLKTEKLGLVSPLDFIPIAEKTKLIIPIGEKVIFKALRFLNRLKDHGFDKTHISINVSIVQLLRPEFTERLLKIIDEMRANPRKICIEITETLFSLDYDDINRIISKLRDAGLHIAIDDFGTGYSSLAREKELSVNCLKIDKHFIDKLLNEAPEKAITGDIISMAHRLGHCTIAEGVEQEEQKRYLLKHGCDKIQGNLIGSPLDEEMAIKLLMNQQN